jgi:hypothetical protein
MIGDLRRSPHMFYLAVLFIAISGLVCCRDLAFFNFFVAFFFAAMIVLLPSDCPHGRYIVIGNSRAKCPGVCVRSSSRMKCAGCAGRIRRRTRPEPASR